MTEHTDQAIVQEALERMGSHAHWREGGIGGECDSCATDTEQRAAGRAALGRLVEALHTAQRELVEQEGYPGIAVDFENAKRERDAAIQERDEARRNLQAVEQQRQWRANERDRAEARLERVEAAARELEDRAVTVWHQAAVGTGIVKVEALNALNESLAAVAAALSDVTPPPSGAAGAVDE
jgi:hypothetical protein